MINFERGLSNKTVNYFHSKVVPCRKTVTHGVIVVAIGIVVGWQSNYSYAESPQPSNESPSKPVDAEAKYQMAKSFLKGSPGKFKLERARHWLSEAATEGHAPAMLELAKLYDVSTGARHERINAYVWYRLAEEHGQTGASIPLKKLLKKMNLGDQGDAQIKYMRMKRELEKE